MTVVKTYIVLFFVYNELVSFLKENNYKTSNRLCLEHLSYNRCDGNNTFCRPDYWNLVLPDDASAGTYAGSTVPSPPV